MPDLGKQTPRKRTHFTYMMDVMRRFEWDMHNRLEMCDRIPDEWHDISTKRPDQAVVRVNIGIEEDVLRFFKSMGKGYGPRINLVLKAFMHARLAGVIDGADTINHFAVREENYSEAKPRFGELARELKSEWSDLAEPERQQYRNAKMWEMTRQSVDKPCSRTTA